MVKGIQAFQLRTVWSPSHPTAGAAIRPEPFYIDFVFTCAYMQYIWRWAIGSVRPLHINSASHQIQNMQPVPHFRRSIQSACSD